MRRPVEPARDIPTQHRPASGRAATPWPATFPTRALVVSGIRIYREGLALALARDARIECLGTAADARAAASAACALAPDVALVDVTMADAVEALAAIAAAAPRVRTVALGVALDDRAVVACAEAGVAGYLTRDDSLADVASAIERVARGEVLCPPEVGAALLRRVSALGQVAAPGAPGAPGAPDARLTARETEIVGLIGEGLPNKTIAQRLCIELPTVKNHVHNILEKLGVSRRDEAAAWLRAHPGRHGAAGTRAQPRLSGSRD